MKYVIINWLVALDWSQLVSPLLWVICYKLIIVYLLLLVSQLIWVSHYNLVAVGWLLWFGYYGLVTLDLLLLVNWLLWVGCCGLIAISWLLWVSLSLFDPFSCIFFRFQEVISFLALALICFLLIRVLNPYLFYTHILPILQQTYFY